MKNNILLVLLSFVMLGASSQVCRGQDVVAADKGTTVQVLFHFPLNKTYLDSTNPYNRAAIAKLKKILSDTSIVNHIDSIYIVGKASPEGTHDHNVDLSEKRAETLKNYIAKQYPDAAQGGITTLGAGENWVGLTIRVKADSRTPGRKKVLEIIEGGGDANVKKSKLQQLLQGAAWRYLDKKHMQYIRIGVVNISYGAIKESLIEEELLAEQPLDQIVEQPMVEEPLVDQFIAGKPLDTVSPISWMDACPRRWGVSMNLLTVIIPNLGVEYFFNEKLSVKLSGAYSYLTMNDYTYKAKLWYLSPEARYYFDKRTPGWCTGQYVSLYGQASHFNVMWDSDGYQGYLGGAGVGYGYKMSLGKNSKWLMDFYAGLGLLYLDYDQYRQWPNDQGAQDNEFLGQHRRYYFGPTKLGIGLNYHF